MKEATKSTNKKKRSPKKGNGFQTITSMFKKQHLATTLRQSEMVACSSLSKEDEKDVFITHVEEKSEYFSEKGKTSKSMNRLSMRKNRTKESVEGTDICTAKRSNVQETIDTDSVVRNLQRTSERWYECEISKETEKMTNDVEQQSCLSDSSMEIDSNRKLSLRKRKSGEEDANLAKKLKYVKDTNPVKKLKPEDDAKLTKKLQTLEGTNLSKNLKSSDDEIAKDHYSDSKRKEILVRPIVSPLSNKVAENYAVDIQVDQKPNHQIPVKKEAG